MQKLLTFFQQNILAYMPYLMIKVLTITTSLALNNWAQWIIKQDNKNKYLVTRDIDTLTTATEALISYY